MSAQRTHSKESGSEKERANASARERSTYVIPESLLVFTETS